MMLFEKYAPSSVDRVAGNEDARVAVKKWALDWSRGVRRKPLLVSGPTGCGKTALVKALAKEVGWELVEVGPGFKAVEVKRFFSSSGSLFDSLRLLFFDEVDGFDKKVVNELAALVEGYSGPVVFVADDAWAQSVSSLRGLCERVELKRVGKYDLKRVLAGVVEKEGLSISPEELKALVDNSEGDLRASLIDLQAGVGFRERKDNVFEALKDLFKANSFADALKAGDSVDIDFDLFQRWIEENIPVEYESPEEVAGAFDVLSKANVFSGRVMRRQNFALYKFVRALSLAGVALAKRETYHKFSRYQFPEVVRLLSNSKKARQTRKELVLKIASGMHCSVSEASACVWLVGLPGARKFFSLSDEEYGLAAGLANFEGDENQGKHCKKAKKVRTS